jgi:hypothetical protein
MAAEGGGAAAFVVTPSRAMPAPGRAGRHEAATRPVLVTRARYGAQRDDRSALP